MYPCWASADDEMLATIVLDPDTLAVTDPEELSIDPGQRFYAEQALDAATEILARATSGVIHGAGRAVDEFVIVGKVRRLSPQFAPLREVVKVEHINSRGASTDLSGWDMLGHSVFFHSQLLRSSGCDPTHGRIRLYYRFGSTVTDGARRALVLYARQLYLGGPGGDLEACQLPERLTSITREGLSMTTFDPMTFLERGLTGIPRVDEWVSSVRTRKALRRSAVYTPAAPPGVNIAVWCAAPDEVPVVAAPRVEWPA